MEDYNIALFLHLVGLAGMFVGIGIETAVLHFARGAKDVATVRTLAALGAPAGRAIPVFAILMLLSGAYMVEDVWDWDTAWIFISLAVFLVLLAMGPLINAQRMKAIGMAAANAPDGPVTPDLREKLEDPVLATSERTMLLATIGIIWLMTVKPEATNAVIAMLVFVAIGIVLSLPAWRTSSSS